MRAVYPASDVNIHNGMLVLKLVPMLMDRLGSIPVRIFILISSIWIMLAALFLLGMMSRVTREQNHFLGPAARNGGIGISLGHPTIVIV